MEWLTSLCNFDSGSTEKSMVTERVVICFQFSKGKEIKWNAGHTDAKSQKLELKNEGTTSWSKYLR